MKHTKKYLQRKKFKSIEKIKDLKKWIKEEENHIHMLNKCLEELE